LALNINPIQQEIKKIKLDFYQKLAQNEFTSKILEQSAHLKGDIVDDIVNILEEFNSCSIVSTQLNLVEQIKAVKYVMEVEFKANIQTSEYAQAIKKSMNTRRGKNLKAELFELLRFDRT
jgi:hypothetical protein